MDFLVEFCRTLIYFLVLGGTAIAGIFVGKTLRARKTKNTTEE